MHSLPDKKIHITRHWGLFIGQLDDNMLHKHYAIQISVTSGTPFLIRDGEGAETNETVQYTGSNVFHQLLSTDILLVLLINPLSKVGYGMSRHFDTIGLTAFSKEIGKGLAVPLKEYVSQSITFEQLVAYISLFLSDLECQCEEKEHLGDDRIYKVIRYFEEHTERIVSLKEAADFCYLSETRFLHLFKERTGLNFRRYQLWNKLIASLPYLRENSITATAHTFGFTDSAHYTRTFRETFGMTPRQIANL